MCVGRGGRGVAGGWACGEEGGGSAGGACFIQPAMHPCLRDGCVCGAAGLNAQATDAWPVAATDPGGEMLQLVQDMRRLRQRALQAEVDRQSSVLAAGSYPAAGEGGEGSG